MNEKVIAVLVWITHRLAEPSTWRGIAVLIGAVFAGVNPDAIAQIGTAVAAIIGGIEVIRQEPAGSIKRQPDAFASIMTQLPAILAMLNPPPAPPAAPATAPLQPNAPVAASAAPEGTLEKVEQGALQVLEGVALKAGEAAVVAAL